MDWMSAVLPYWIICAPLGYLIVDWLRTPKSAYTASHRI